MFRFYISILFFNLFATSTRTTFIPNFGEYCLTHIINYEGKDLQGFTHPILLSRHEQVASTTYDSTTKIEIVECYHILYEKTVQNPAWFWNLNLSEFSGNKIDTLFKDHTLTARWNCLTAIFLFPPSQMLERGDTSNQIKTERYDDYIRL